MRISKGDDTSSMGNNRISGKRCRDSRGICDTTLKFRISYLYKYSTFFVRFSSIFVIYFHLILLIYNPMIKPRYPLQILLNRNLRLMSKIRIPILSQPFVHSYPLHPLILHLPHTFLLKSILPIGSIPLIQQKLMLIDIHGVYNNLI